MTTQSILITGAAGGIGRASAADLARRGYAIVVADLDQGACDAVAAELRAEGAAAVGAALDVTDLRSAEAAVAEAVRLGEFVALVNCAGIVHLGEIEDVSSADWERVLGVNLTGTFNLCKAAVPFLSGSGASIVNLTSTAGRTSSTYSSPAYVASKAGVIGLTMSLAKQLASSNIRVNAVAPGIIDTAMMDLYGDERKARLVTGIPLGRMGTTAEVATTVAYLATPESSYVTGQTIAINGGTFIS